MQTGSLGSTIFEVSSSKVLTPKSVGFSREASFEDHQVQGSYPRPEFLAPGLASVSLAITLRADLGVEPWAEAEALEEKMIAGEVLRLVIAGQNLGKFTIRKIDQSWHHCLRGHAGPLILDLGLELKEYW